MDEPEHWRPRIFYSSGVNQGLLEPFPAPTHIRRKERSSYNRGTLFPPGVNGHINGQFQGLLHNTNRRRHNDPRAQEGRSGFTGGRPNHHLFNSRNGADERGPGCVGKEEDVVQERWPLISLISSFSDSFTLLIVLYARQTRFLLCSNLKKYLGVHNELAGKQHHLNYRKDGGRPRRANSNKSLSFGFKLYVIREKHKPSPQRQLLYFGCN